MIQFIHIHPNDINVDQFNDCIESIYPESLWNLKKSEKLCTRFLMTIIIAKRENRTIARVALYQNPNLFYNHQLCLTAGSYECDSDPITSSKFWKYIIDYCKQLDAMYLIGPMNGSTWDNYRLNLQNNEPIFLSEQIQKNYYKNHFIDNGFKVLAKYYSSKTNNIQFQWNDIQDYEQYFLDQKVKLRNIDLDNYTNELNKLHPFLQKAFENNFLFTPIDLEEFIEKYLSIKKYLIDKYILIAEDENNHIIGLFFCVKNIFNAENNELIIKTIARDPQNKWKGLGHWMAHHLYNVAYENSIDEIIHAFMKIEGTSEKISSNFQGIPYKYYELFYYQLKEHTY